MGSITDVYSSVCKELKLRTNRYILEVLQETEGKTGDITLKLTGNDRLRKVEQVTNKDALALSRTLRDNDSVTGLDLRYNCITDEGAGHLADLLKSNDALLSLRLTGNKIGNGGAMHFASMLQVNSTLQELDVADSDLGTQSVIAFAIVLNNNKSLRSVNISRPLLFSHQEETAVHLSGMLVVNQCLRELHLGKMGMTDCGVERLTDALRTNYTLKYLDLRCNRVTRDGARCLAKVLKNNGTLEILDLAFNRIEDDGALYLSQAIALPTCNLKALFIPSNNIATVGLVSLSRAMQANNTLTHIYIWGNRLEEPVCQAFSDLLSSGRLSSEQTDVCVYEVDGCVCLAEIFHGLKRHYYWTPSYGQDGNPASNAAVTLTNTQLYPN
ncbi:leucine-rich repeat-containing protein 34 isoform X2 [Salvelinus sp. IW2-2015]|uniref:leucine-rich repeat-containing protein 34 isoform X2 n=1 Tax=Salvelinus sp. IW2-2015 TaxID=2691554 RepID=UPI000CDF96DC|nr:leucine-rich repeat-containing protein 34 isoform X2 [Salvelinus alpinus]